MFVDNQKHKECNFLVFFILCSEFNMVRINMDTILISPVLLHISPYVAYATV